MELDPLRPMTTVTQPQDNSVRRGRGDLEIGGHLPGIDDQRMVAGRVERVRQTLEQGGAVVADRAGLAVHERRGSDDPSAERLPDRLMTQTDAQDRPPAGETAHDLERDSGPAGPS